MLFRIPLVNIYRPAVLFCTGLAIVLLSLTVSIPPVWNTFIHSWRVEFFASVFLAITLVVALFASRRKDLGIDISKTEFNFIVLPITALIIWSALSASWAPSWKSAIHHALVWSEYLIFFLLLRYLLNRERNYSRLLNTIGGTLLFFAILAILGYCSFIIFNGGVAIGIIYAKWGEQVNTIFPLVLVGVLRLSGKKLAGGIAVLSCLWLLVFCSLSRTNLILFAGEILVIAGAIFTISRFRRYRLKMAVVCAILILSPLPLRLASLFSTESEVPTMGRMADTATISSSNNFRKLMLSIGFEMISEHPIAGIGADNFGFEANKYRATYAAENPDDPNLAEAEDTIPERAHNEYLQIAAETGAVGSAIFLWFLTGIGIMTFRAQRQKKRLSMYPIAALTGVAIFLASSLVTSYSFRLIQNGFVFFFVLAVAGRIVFGREQRVSAPLLLYGPRLRLACSAGIAISLLLTIYCGIRVTSVIYGSEANATASLDEAIPIYKKAMRIDDENPEAPYFLGLRLVDKERYSEAVPYLKESIRIGKAPSADFSYLASAQSLAGDDAGAEETFAEAAALYPRSPFVLTRYAALLQLNGKPDDSSRLLDRSRKIDLKQTNTWWAMITQSPQAATDLALWQKDYVPLMELQPQTAMYAVKAEREIRHPEEKFKFRSMSGLGLDQ